MGKVYQNSLFSNHYLENRLKQTKEWNIDLKEQYKKLREIYFSCFINLDDWSESELENKFIQPIIENVLDFNQSYKVQPNLTGLSTIKNPDYALFISLERYSLAQKSDDFWSKVDAVLEAKKYNRKLDGKILKADALNDNQVPSNQILNYLYFSNVKWGILTNGALWRIYYRENGSNLSKYYEINLEDIIKDNNVENFKYFYLFFSRITFEKEFDKCFLDRILEGSISYSEQIGENLKINIYDALETLVKGFAEFEYNEMTDFNEIKLKEIYDNSLIVLYRILFVLFAESRNLLPLDNENYKNQHSLQKLIISLTDKNKKGEKETNSSENYWRYLQELFKFIDKGNKEFEIPVYNGGLFKDSNDSFLSKYSVSDQCIAKVLNLLCVDHNKNETGFLDYSSLDVQHLGSIYEGILEYKISLAKDDLVIIKEKGKEKVIPFNELSDKKSLLRIKSGTLYLSNDSGDRKSTGSYYTPDYIVKYIVENTLKPIVEQIDSRKLSEQDILSEYKALKILDPACGSGHFLVEVVNFLALNLADRVTFEDLESSFNICQRIIVENCVYGVDLNKMAVELTKLSLWLHTFSKNKPLSFLDHHIKCGNSLIGTNLLDIRKSLLDKNTKTLGSDIYQKHIDTMLKYIRQIDELPSDKIEDIKNKEKLYKNYLDYRVSIKKLADIFVSFEFGNKVDTSIYESMKMNPLSHDTVQALSNTDLEWVKQAEELANKYSFFHWDLEFPNVFLTLGNDSQHGFDAIVGNPPYVNARNMDMVIRQNLTNKFKLLQGSYDLYLPFILFGPEILKSSGRYGWIIPNKLLIQDYAKTTLSWLKDNSLYLVIKISELPIFKNVGVYPILIFGDKIKKINELNIYSINNIDNLYSLASHKVDKNNFKRYKTFLDYGIKINSGTTGFEAQKIIPLISDFKVQDSFRFIVSGSVDPYILLDDSVYYMKHLFKTPFIKKDNNIISNSKWSFWQNEKIVVSGMTKRIEAVYIKTPLALGVGVYGIYDFADFNPLFLLSILNSRFLTYYLNIEFKDKHLAGGYLAINKSTIEQLPLIKISPEEQKPFIEKADIMLSLNKELHEKTNNFLTVLKSTFSLDKISTKLDKFYELNQDEFIKEITKLTKKSLSFTEKQDLLPAFIKTQFELVALKQKINLTDKEIDQLVYKLYDLTPEEIKIVEDSLKK